MEISHSLVEMQRTDTQKYAFLAWHLYCLFLLSKSLQLKWFSWPLLIHPRVPTCARNIYHLSLFMELRADLDIFHTSILERCACNQWPVSKTPMLHEFCMIYVLCLYIYIYKRWLIIVYLVIYSRTGHLQRHCLSLLFWVLMISNLHKNIWELCQP